MFSCLNLNLDQNIIMTTLHKDVSAFRSNVKCNPLIFVKKGTELNKIHIFSLSLMFRDNFNRIFVILRSVAKYGLPRHDKSASLDYYISLA